MSDDPKKSELRIQRAADVDGVRPIPQWKEALLRQADERRARAEALDLEYRGYRATCRVEPATGRIVCHVINTSRSVISFEGAMPEMMKREMIRSIDDYLEFCKEQRIQPEKPRRKALRA